MARCELLLRGGYIIRLFEQTSLTALLHSLANKRLPSAFGNAPMAKDGLTYSDAVRAAAAEAAAALGTSPEAVRPSAIRARRQPGNDGKAHVLLEVDAENGKAAPRKGRDVRPADARTITTLEACIADLRSLLAKAEERAADERSRCDRLIAETLAANARAAHHEGELTALRSRPVPWWRWWRQANGA